ncbi:MAG TPA: argininosuccinate lyase [Rickettsiales bacterium]|nr:argininosuccinate lyase [Rickettsiales bacterium]
MATSKSKNTKKEAQANPMWGGQFASGPAEIMARINASIDFDSKLYSQDIKGSIAHCTMLAETGIITKKEASAIIKGLESIKVEIESGKFIFKQELEDIHMNIEARLAELIGDVAGKLHTARSRNDQAVLDFRMFVRDAAQAIEELLKGLQAALIARAEEYCDTIMPGFTHLQSAQPVTLGHHMMAYVEMFGRDRGRVNDLLARLDECPLGAAALAGTSFQTDRHMTAKLLGFARPTANSLDSVSDRDFALEFLSAASISAVHLSRLAEEFVIWSSAPFAFIRFSDLFTTGSSIMPQKRNPDAAELVRGKTGRIVGSLMSLLTTLKGLPLAYNKDMQEDKEPVFDASLQWQMVLSATAGMVEDFKADKQRMHALAGDGYSTATDLADWLVRTQKMPFRQAHHATARIVKIAAMKKCQLSELALEDMKSIEPAITKDIYNYLTVEKSVASRTSFGGTSPVRVKEAIKAAKKKYL